MSAPSEKRQFSALIWPRLGGNPPKLVWILEERPDGWLVEEIQHGDTRGVPPKKVVLSRELWTRTEASAETTVDVAAKLPSLGSWPIVRP